LICGIQYLHVNKIAHLNICPANILLTVDGKLKIADFTLAQSFRGPRDGEKTKIELSSSNHRCPSYLAPEVFVERQSDPRAVDMWAFAITYMETKTGKHLLNLAAEGGDEYYDKYLQDRHGLWGYRPVENLENVSYSIPFKQH